MNQWAQIMVGPRFREDDESDESSFEARALGRGYKHRVARDAHYFPRTAVPGDGPILSRSGGWEVRKGKLLSLRLRRPGAGRVQFHPRLWLHLRFGFI